jgi:hypothetical protein
MSESKTKEDIIEGIQRRYAEAVEDIKTALPPSLSIYNDVQLTLIRMTDEELAHTMRAALMYFNAGELPENLERAEELTFESIKGGIDRNLEKYRAGLANKIKAAFIKNAREKGINLELE